jgi:hypothetical protein
MRRTFEIPVAAVVPSGAAVLRAMGGTTDRSPGPRVERLLEEALEEFRAKAEPRAVTADIGAREFAEVYEGAGDNEPSSPLLAIFPRAERLALFAATVGAELSDRIAELFDAGRPALGAALDSAASEGTELAGVHLDGLAQEEARSRHAAGPDTWALRYSPGYCGWNITGQRALFAALRPDEIGILLTDSCLMQPLKSISGVMVTGPAAIHEIADDYPFCPDCRTKSCRSRMRKIRQNLRKEP